MCCYCVEPLRYWIAMVFVCLFHVSVYRDKSTSVNAHHGRTTRVAPHYSSWSVVESNQVGNSLSTHLCAAVYNITMIGFVSVRKKKESVIVDAISFPAQLFFFLCHDFHLLCPSLWTDDNRSDGWKPTPKPSKPYTWRSWRTIRASQSSTSAPISGNWSSRTYERTTPASIWHKLVSELPFPTLLPPDAL